MKKRKTGPKTAKGCEYEADSVESHIAEFAPLSGYSTKRLPHKDSNDNGWPQWDKSKIRIDQLCLGHAMAHFCKDHQGQSLIYYAGKDLLQDQVFHGRPSTSSIFQTLLQGSSKFAQKVAFIMNTDEVFRVHFGNLAHKKHKIFAKKKGHPVPQLVMPG